MSLAYAPDGTERIDAAGKFVFPGFIDPHVHIYLPFMGTYAKDTYDSGSRAALVGGTTTLIEMCCPSRQEEPLEAFGELWVPWAACCPCWKNWGMARPPAFGRRCPTADGTHNSPIGYSSAGTSPSTRREARPGKGEPPRRVTNHKPLLAEFQNRLRRDGVELSWPRLTPR